VGCVSTTNKRELVRVVRTPEGSVVADPTGKKPGRGAYVHADENCWTQAFKRGALERSLKTAISSADKAALQEYAGAVVSR
jgi:predicted RNA-binding protein YlxR (DUF448 family)